MPKEDAGADPGGPPGHPPATVAIIVTAFDHAHFLADALDSALAQTRPANEVIIVDDGSQDDIAAVAAGYPSVTIVRQDNAGLAAARNLGLESTQADFVLFLDADDKLWPEAIDSALQCALEHPGTGFVYGGHRRVNAALKPISEPYRPSCGPSPYYELLQGNFVRMHGAVLYDRAKLAAAGGFDTSLRRCEDYDAYFRMVERHPIAGHPAIMADYRFHGANMSADLVDMLEWGIRVQERYRPRADDRKGQKAFRKGQRRMRRANASGVWRDRGELSAAERWRQRLDMTRKLPQQSLSGAVVQGIRRWLPRPVERTLKRWARPYSPPVGKIDMGDLARTRPISTVYGADRGTPIDRYYIDRFLADRGPDIRGHVLEIGETTYSRRFGTGVVKTDVLHVHARNPEATIIGDLSQQGILPSATFDCAIVTQTLQLVYDMPAALHELHASLKPGGVLLATVPGVTAVVGEWGEYWCWSLTGLSCTRLFGDVFGTDNVTVEVHGNVYAATTFLQGLSVEEVEPEQLDKRDPAYPVTITVRARRGG